MLVSWVRDFGPSTQGVTGAADLGCPQHFLYFFELPQGHGSFLPGITLNNLRPIASR
jgi:hypothetical protein